MLLTVAEQKEFDSLNQEFGLSESEQSEFAQLESEFGTPADLPPVKEPISEEIAFDRAGMVWDTSVEFEVPLDVADQYFYDPFAPVDPDDFSTPIPDNRVGFSEEFKKQWATKKGITKIPIVGGILGIEQNMEVMSAANRLTDAEFDYDARNRRNDAVNAFTTQQSSVNRMIRPIPSGLSKERDEKVIADAIKDFEFQARGKKFGAKVAAGVSQMPTWMVEFAATGGLASLGDDAARKAGEKLLGKYVKTTAGKAAIKSAGLVTGAVVRSSTGLLPRVGEKATARQAQIDLGVAGEEGWGISLAKAWGDTVIESFSEETGGLLVKGGGKLLNKLPFGKKFVASLRDVWIKFTGGTADNFANKMLTKAGYSSILGELGEERVGTLLREATGVSDRKGKWGERIWEGMKEDLQPSNLGSELVTLLAPASVRRGFAMGASLTKGVESPTDADQLDAAIESGAIQFDTQADAQGFADQAGEVAGREGVDVNITADLDNNTVTVESTEVPLVGDLKGEIDRPVPGTVKEQRDAAVAKQAEERKASRDKAVAGAEKTAETPAVEETQAEPTIEQPAPVEGVQAKQEGAVEVSPETKVVDEKGEPLTVFHGTRADFDKFRPLSHFGTEKAANQALESATGAGKDKVISAELSLENPLEVKDTVGTTEDVIDWVWQAEDLGVVTENEAVTIESIVTETGEIENAEKAFIELMESKGFDGLKYINKTEDKGSVSYVVFRPEQVISQPTPQAEEVPRGTIEEEKRIISTEAFEAAKARIKERRGRLTAGVDPGDLADAVIIGGFYVESGIRNFADWSKKMVADFGEDIKPHLKDIWDSVNAERKPETKAPVEKKPAPKAKKADKPRVTPAQKKAEADIKQRGFISSVKTALPELKVEGTYIPRSTDELSIKAKNLVQDDIKKAEALALKGDSDKSVATASELLKHYNEQAKLATTQIAKDAFYDKAAIIANDIAAKLTEAGRTVQAAIILTRLTPEGQVRFAAREIQKHNEKIEKSKGGLFGLQKKIPELTPEQAKKILTEMEAIEEMPPGEAKAKRFQKLQNSISDLVPTPLFKKLITIWKAGLLTGLKTSGLNIMSTTANVLTERAAKIPATVIDKVIAIGTGKRTVTASIKGVKQGGVQGAKRGFDYLTTGYDERNIGVKLDYKRVNMGKGKLARALQLYTDSVFRLLGAEDQPFYYSAKVMSLFEQSKVAAINEGLKGKEAQKFIDNLMKDPTEDMIKNASKDAEAAVFQNKTKLGDLAKGIQGLGGGIGEIVVPFGRTPSAVAMQIINYSPVGAVKTIIDNIGKGKFDQRDFVNGLGRSIVGSIPLVIGAALWEEDMLTLDYPKTQKERDLWKLEGRKANSIKVDGKWRTIQSFGPAGNLLIVGGHFKRAFSDSGSPTEAMTEAILGSGKSFTEQTFLQGVNQVTSAINDPERSGPQLARGLVSSVIPTIVGDVARATDPVERRTGTVAGRVKAKIPGLRGTLEPQITVLGEERKATSNPLEIMIDPTRPSKDISTPLVKELRRLTDEGFDVTPSQLGNKDGFDILTPAENTKLWIRAGELTKGVLEGWVNSDGYKAIDNDFVKSKSINALTTRMQAAAKAEMVGIKLKQGLSVFELAEAGLLSVDGLNELKFFTQ